MNIVNPRLRALALVPRPLGPELEQLVSEVHPWSIHGARIQLLAVAGALVFVPMALLGKLPWAALIVPATLVGIGWSMRRIVRAQSIAQGRERLARLPLSLVTVVQANHSLYDPEEAVFAPAVIAYARGPQAHDVGFMLDVARRIAALRDQRSGELGLDQIAALLEEEQSTFSRPVPAWWSGPTEVTVTTTFLRSEQLPGGYLHPDSVLAAFLDERGSLDRVLPAALYS